MKDKDFKIEVLRLLNKISDQLNDKTYLVSSKLQKKSITKMTATAKRQICINELVKTLGPNILNYIKH